MSFKVLIISPFFPPSNTADMQRVRMSLPYFNEFDWDATVVTIDDKYTDAPKDELLLQGVPSETKIYKVKALNKKITSKFGLGSAALRSLWYYRQKVNKILSTEKFDLIYFSTTELMVCVLGPYWKKRFDIPYIIDMQDPWYSDYYKNKPKNERPPKYWLSSTLHSYLEPIAIKNADGLISVSDVYIANLKKRYPEIKHLPSVIITFGAFKPDFKITADNEKLFEPLLKAGFKNMVYVGRGGVDMYKAISPLFEAIKNGVKNEPELFSKLKCYFVGTSYAPVGKGAKTILPLAKQFNIEGHCIEITDRIAYYHTLLLLKQADALFIPGSDSPGYTASKLYPYLLTKKPLLALFNSQSPALSVLKEYNAPYAYSYDTTTNIESKISIFLKKLVSDDFTVQEYNTAAIDKYSAQNMTKLQCDFFNLVLSKTQNGSVQ